MSEETFVSDAASVTSSLPAPFHIEPLTIACGKDAAAQLLSSDASDETLRAIDRTRRALAREVGIVFPGVHLRDDQFLSPDGYAIFVNRRKCASGTLLLDARYALGSAEVLARFSGAFVAEPIFGSVAKCIEPEDVAEAEAAGANVFDALRMLTAHLGVVVRERAAFVISFQTFCTHLEYVKRVAPAVTASIGEAEGQLSPFRAFLSIREALRRALPPRDFIAAIEILTDAHRRGDDLAAHLHERLSRAALAHRRTSVLGIVALDPDLAAAFASAGDEPDLTLEIELRRFFAACVAPASAGIVAPRASYERLARWAALRELPVPVYADDLVPSTLEPRSATVDDPFDSARVASEIRRFAPPSSPAGPSDAAVDRPKPEAAFAVLDAEPVVVACGAALATALIGDEDGHRATLDLAERMRAEVGRETGFSVGAIGFRADPDLLPRAYDISIRGVRLAHGALRLGRVLALGRREVVAALSGIRTREPVYGLQAKWIPTSAESEARSKGAMTFPPIAVLVSHVGRILRDNLDAVCDASAFAVFLERLCKHAPATVGAIRSEQIGIALAHDVIRELLAERIWLEPLVALECIIEGAQASRDSATLAELTRRRIVPALLSHPIKDLVVLAVEADVDETTLRVHAARTRRDSAIVVAPAAARRRIAALAKREGIDVRVFARDEVPFDVLLLAEQSAA